MPSKSRQKDDLGPRKIKEKVIKKESKKRKRKKKKQIRKIIETDFFFSTFSVSGTKIFSHVTSHYISATISQGRADDLHLIGKKVEVQDFIDLLHPPQEGRELGIEPF